MSSVAAVSADSRLHGRTCTYCEQTLAVGDVGVWVPSGTGLAAVEHEGELWLMEKMAPAHIECMQQETNA